MRRWKGDITAQITSDPELRAFVDAQKATKPPKQIVEECLARFGEVRAPSVTCITRYFALADGAAAADYRRRLRTSPK